MFFTGEDILGDSHCSGCLALSTQSGEEVPFILPTMSHHWNLAAEGEESIFIRKVIKRNFLLKMLVKRFFQQPLSCSPMEEARWKLDDQRCHQPKCSGMWWSNFSVQILKKPQPFVLVPKRQLRSLDNLVLRLALGVLCDTCFSGAVIRLSLFPSSSFSTGQSLLQNGNPHR